MDIDKQPIPQFLETQRDTKTPAELQHYFLDFEDFWERKLWHQLTQALTNFFEDPASGPQRLDLYKGFVLTFADKINQLQLVALALNAAEHCKDRREALEFIETVAKKVNSDDSQDAYVYAIVEVARHKLFLGDTDGARVALDEAEKKLEKFDSVEQQVHAAFYRVNADYYNAKFEFAPYYRNALLYLACCDISELAPAEAIERAYSLSVAALAGRGIYNFGELLLHPILATLEKTEHAWLRELLFAFNSGDLAKYHALSGHFPKQQLLLDQADFLKEKIQLSALTEAVFRRAPHDRALSFATVCEETGVSMDQVEHLLMRALSLELIRGRIDQVAEVAKISWVQPKVLDKDQIAGMRQRLLEWDSGVAALSESMAEKMRIAPEATPA